MLQCQIFIQNMYRKLASFLHCHVGVLLSPLDQFFQVRWFNVVLDFKQCHLKVLHEKWWHNNFGHLQDWHSFCTFFFFCAGLPVVFPFNGSFEVLDFFDPLIANCQCCCCNNPWNMQTQVLFCQYCQLFNVCIHNLFSCGDVIFEDVSLEDSDSLSKIW